MFKKDQKKDSKAVSTMIIAGVVVGVVAVAAIAAYFFMGGGGDGGDEGPTVSDMAVGDYLKYEVVATNGDSVLDYIYWYNVTAVNSTSFSIKETEYLNGFYYAEYNRTISRDSVISLIATMPSGMNDVGRMTLDTVFGSREVRHYQGVHMGENLDFYFGVSNGMLYRYTYALGSTSGEMNLVGSNLSWA